MCCCSHGSGNFPPPRQLPGASMEACPGHRGLLHLCCSGHGPAAVSWTHSWALHTTSLLTALPRTVRRPHGHGSTLLLCHVCRNPCGKGAGSCPAGATKQLLSVFQYSSHSHNRLGCSCVIPAPGMTGPDQGVERHWGSQAHR